MQRRRDSEKVRRFLYRIAEPEGNALRSRAVQFVNEQATQIKAMYESIDLSYLPDRDAEAWQPLFAILAVADSERIAELRNCAQVLTGTKSANAEDDSIALRLLSDLRFVWPDDEPHILTAELISRLKNIEESPWNTEVDLNPHKLSSLLRGFGIRPGTVRVGERNAKGYTRDDANAAFCRYLRPEKSHPSQPA